MKTLIYNELDITGVEKQYTKIVKMLEGNDFRSAEVKKISNTSLSLYRAKLDYSNRLLFKIVKYNSTPYALLLEVIHNHEYDKSRFLNGSVTDDTKLPAIISTSQINSNTLPVIPYINTNGKHFNVLDKILSFDNIQKDIFKAKTPLILIGSAGSGKTVLTLEKLKHLHGDGLYITLSPFLVENSRNLYYSNNYLNDRQNIEFLSFTEFFETLKVPSEKQITPNDFDSWFLQNKSGFKIKDTHKLYEEFNGVITGSAPDKEFISRNEYLNLGIKQSIFQKNERNDVYDIFHRYEKYINSSNFYDSNILSYKYLKYCSSKYDFAVIDEVQDLTVCQLNLIMKSLKNPHNFILCGDSNQIVHPNFFAWSNVKSMLYKKKTPEQAKLTRILNTNYRNSPEITDLANRLLLIKNARFGSIDKESNFLVNSIQTNRGNIELLNDTPAAKAKLDKNTSQSTKYAVIVMHEEYKKTAEKIFHTPLIFSIQEAKGLEYENIIIYNFISHASKEFSEISEGISINALAKTELKYARSRNKTDKSLETYKFYINSLYVAVTRAVKNLFIIENNNKHNLLQLLNLTNFKEQTKVKIQMSDTDAWKNEAVRLELQGKKEQADKIKNTMLGTKKVPWEILTHANLEKLKADAFNPEKYNKKAKTFIFEFATVYHVPYLIDTLSELKFNRANKNASKEQKEIEKKYYSDYSQKNYSILNDKIKKYGIDFRNQLNQTPLMIAVHQGKIDLVKSLKVNGANIKQRDCTGMQPLHIALRQSFLNSDYSQNILGHIYKDIETSSIKVKVYNKMIKIDNSKMPFFIFYLMLSAQVELMKNKIKYDIPAFEAGDFVRTLASFPEFIMPEYRKKRSYISSILAENEIYKEDKNNKKLFLRVRRGYYMINPVLEVDIDGEWINAYTLMQMDHYMNSPVKTHSEVIKYLKECKKRIAKHLSAA
jgi:hypothetical protein